MIDLFNKHIDNNLPFLHGKKLLVCVSGGADSVVLFSLINKMNYTDISTNWKRILKAWRNTLPGVNTPSRGNYFISLISWIREVKRKLWVLQVPIILKMWLILFKNFARLVNKEYWRKKCKNYICIPCQIFCFYNISFNPS